MKVILKAISKPVKGTRDVVINRIETHASDEDISNNTDKSCFVLSDVLVVRTDQPQDDAPSNFYTFGDIESRTE